MNKPLKVEIDRGDFGFCNICLRHKKLSWEHVVPQAALFYDELVLTSLKQRIHGKLVDYRQRFSQNGLKLRTVCSGCNSRLGRELDPALIDFLRTVKNYAETKLLYNSVLSINCRPNAIIRAVIGHLIAAKFHVEYSEFDEVGRELLFDYSKPIPDNLNVFYWAYPFKNIGAFRDVIMLSERGNFNSTSVFQILKCYPVSFLVTDVKEYSDLFPLWGFNSMKPTKTAIIPLNLFAHHPPDWPESVDEDNILAVGQAGECSITGMQKKDRYT